MHTQIIMSQNLVTEIKKKLTHSKIGTQTTFQIDMSSKLALSLSIPLAMLKPSPVLLQNLIFI